MNSSAAASASELPGYVPRPPRTWQEQLAKHWWGRKIADEALQVEKDQQRQQMLQRLMKKQQDGTVGEATDDPGPEDMAVSVGDQYHWHPPTAGSGLGKLLGGLALGASLVGGPLATYLLTRPETTPTSPTIVQGDRNTDTSMLLEFDEIETPAGNANATE